MNLKSENRSYPRAAANMEVTYVDDSSPQPNYAQTRDFSATGISFPVTKKYEKGDMLTLEINIPEITKVIKSRATVVRNWHEGDTNYVSVQFFDIAYHDFIYLLDYSLTYHIEV